jgi:hypothetical protein
MWAIVRELLVWLRAESSPKPIRIDHAIDALDRQRQTGRADLEAGGAQGPS